MSSTGAGPTSHGCGQQGQFLWPVGSVGVASGVGWHGQGGGDVLVQELLMVGWTPKTLGIGTWGSTGVMPAASINDAC